MTGAINPDDATLNALNTELQKPQTGYYVWNTVGDDRVRGEHEALEGTIRSWDNSPDPGEDFNCRCWAEPVPDNIQIINNPKDRIKSILNNTPAIFEIKIDKNAKSSSPWYENPILAKASILQYDDLIKEISQKRKIDPDLIRSVMWSENSRGSWGGLGYVADAIGVSNTIMPMNINPDIWFKLGNVQKEDFYKTKTNIEVSAMLLQRIKERIISPSPEKIAAIWEYIGQEKTNDYASYVGRIYKEKPWKK